MRAEPGKARHVTRDEFEQLVSQWLDHPECTRLARQVREAAAADPELARLRDGWVSFDQCLRRRVPSIPPVRWDVLRKRITQAIHTNEQALKDET